MASADKFSVLARRLLPLVPLALFAIALWVLHDALRQFHYQHVLAQLRAIPAGRILAAFGLTVVSYAVLTCYDRLAIAYVRHPVGVGKVSLASFVSYAFSNSIGLSLLASGSIRYRFYSAWGLPTETIARLVAFTVLTFLLGILAIGGLVLVLEPLSLRDLGRVPVMTSRPVGALFLALAAGYLLTVLGRQKPFRLHKWLLPLPSLRLAGAQMIVGALDWALAGGVLYLLLPASADFTFPGFLAIFLLAQVVALISHVPDGLGVFETMVLLSSPGVPADALLGALLVYRGIYYLLPLLLAALLLAGNELLQKKSLVGQAVRLAGNWASVMIPQPLAITTLVSGAVLLFSGATPAIPGRLHLLNTLLPLPVIELSHFLGSLAGAALMLLARGLQRRLDAAYLLTAVLLADGSLFSLFKGADYEDALLLGAMLAALLPCRRHFYRKASLLSEPFSPGWNVTVLLVFASSLWLGIFAYKHVAYNSELWGHFTLRGDAPRFLRAAVGAAVLLLVASVARLLRPAPRTPGLPEADDLERARQIAARSPATLGNLALLGDKALLFVEEQESFVMYQATGRSWVALGDPIGPSEAARDLAWRFRELAERHGGKAVFYEVGTDLLHLYLDLGLTLFKLGEAARVPLAGFSLEGSEHSGLR